MNTKTLRILGSIVATLLLIYLLMSYTGQSTPGSVRFIPDLKSQINSVDSVTVHTGGEHYTLTKAEASWQVADRKNYPADVGKLRELLIALSDAVIVETKTSDPEKYAMLGVEEPVDAKDQATRSRATQFTIKGANFEHDVIIGKATQGNYRFARLAGEAQSVLINKNPDIPESIDGWLMSDLLDIASERIITVRLDHADGETIEIAKGSDESSNYDVLNIPDGRELTYGSVANGIAGALEDLKLEDVRPAEAHDEPPGTTTTFETSDGLQIVATSISDGGAQWVAFTASVVEPVSSDEQADDQAPDNESALPVKDEADHINARLSVFTLIY